MAAGAILCGLAIGLPIGLLIGAVILRAAISIANKVLGPPRQSEWDDEYDGSARRRRRFGSDGVIPEPGIGKAMLIVLATGFVNFIVSFAIGFAIGAGGAAAQANAQRTQALAQLAGLPVSFLVMSGMLTMMLPTTFPRACLVTVFQFLISLLIVGVIFGAFLLMGFGLGAAGR
jgi:hypothetical protein